jgi:hypothetical protein
MKYRQNDNKVSLEWQLQWSTYIITINYFYNYNEANRLFRFSKRRESQKVIITMKHRLNYNEVPTYLQLSLFWTDNYNEVPT